MQATTTKVTLKEMRNILKSKARYFSFGFSANDIVIELFNEIRKEYIRKVGLTTYLREMLGDLGRTSIRYCALYGEDGRRIELQLNGNDYQSVHRFIARQFQLCGKLPLKIEIQDTSNLDQVEICYL